MENPLFGKTITLEFYIDNNKKLHTIYNRIDYIFQEFWSKVDNADYICQIIYLEFERQFQEKFKTASINSRDWKETLLKFINTHLHDNDKILDIVIRNSGEISISLEHS